MLSSVNSSLQVKLTVSHTERFVVCVSRGGKLFQHVGCDKRGLCCEFAEGDYIFFFGEVIDCLLKLLVAQALLKIYRNIPENGGKIFDPAS